MGIYVNKKKKKSFCFENFKTYLFDQMKRWRRITKALLLLWKVLLLFWILSWLKREWKSTCAVVLYSFRVEKPFCE